jgi:hypothetical protein
MKNVIINVFFLIIVVFMLNVLYEIFNIRTRKTPNT